MLPRFFILLISFLFITASFAQEESREENRECIRLRAIGMSAGTVENYIEATEYFIKAEAICPYFGKDNYDRLLTCILNVMAQEDDTAEVYQAYLDTLLMVWSKAEEKECYDPMDDIIQGYHYTLLRNPDYQKADMYMSRAIKTQGTEIEDEVYLLLYYYNIYAMWYIEEDEEAKGALKQRYIKEYFELTELIKEASFAASTRETLTQYLAQVITSCDDLLPLVPEYLESLPENPEDKKTALVNIEQLLIDQGCTDSDAFKRITEVGYQVNPENIELIDRIIEFPCSQRIPIYKEMKEQATDPDEKNALQYKIATCYMNMGSYNKAYAAAQNVSGELASKGLKIQAQCVAATANSCGNSTFDRKCNYIYSAILMEQAGLDGSSYRALGPQIEVVHQNQIIEATLVCWGVTIDLVTETIVSE